MSKKPIAIVRSKFYVPKNLVKIEQVEDHFTHTLYEEGICAKCPYLKERHSYMCDSCQAYLGETKTYSKIFRNDIEYIGLPLGQKRMFLNFLKINSFKELDIKDFRYDTKFDYPITFGGKLNGELRDYQKLMLDDFLKEKYGIIESPPRSGKTITALAIGIANGSRMLVVADQKEFLSQFEDHVRDFSNLPELEKKHDIVLFGRAKKYEDFAQYQIATATVQTFYSKKGKELLKKICPHYGMVWVDECHKSSSPVFLKTISSMPIKVKWGATGTNERKDGKHRMLRDVLGPVVASSTVESMMPNVSVIWTGFKPKRSYSSWVYAMKWIADNEERNEMIIEHVLKDVERGHSIILPCLFREHITYLTRRINAEYGSRIADYFMGGGDKKNLSHRTNTLDDAKSGKIKVVVGTRSILQLGLNVPRWSAIYSLFPISNKPNLKQETSRIRTPMEGKMTPEIKFFVDDMTQSLWCFKSSIHHIQQFKYNIEKDSYPMISRAFRAIGVKNWLGQTDDKVKSTGRVEKINGEIF